MGLWKRTEQGAVGQVDEQVGRGRGGLGEDMIGKAHVSYEGPNTNNNMRPQHAKVK